MDEGGFHAWFGVTKNEKPEECIPCDTSVAVIEVCQTPKYETWFASLKDRTARARVDMRIRRLSLGHLGAVEPVGEGVSELKIDHGPGYRVYFVQHGGCYDLLLVGGD